MVRLMIVDDEEQNLEWLQDLFEREGYEVTTAVDGSDALTKIETSKPDIILSDVLMPVMDGFALCRELKKDEQLQAIPFIFFSATYKDSQDEELAYKLGAVRFLRKPMRPEDVVKNMSDILAESARSKVNIHQTRKIEEDVFLREHAAIISSKLVEKVRELEMSLATLQKAFQGTIEAMAVTVETRDPYTAGHQKRVAELSSTIAREMGLEENHIEGVGMAGLIHDLGKISVPAEILSKPGKLWDVEFEIVMRHPESGYEILKKIEFPWPVARIVLQHHERYDGSGYPHGLKGKEPLIEARIISVADVVEAMASHRPYRAALGLEAALEEIASRKNVLYDPDIVDVCLRILKEGRFAWSTGG